MKHKLVSLIKKWEIVTKKVKFKFNQKVELLTLNIRWAILFHLVLITLLKVALSRKVLDDFYFSKKKYSKSLSRAENWNFPPITVNSLFKFSAQDRDL